MATSTERSRKRRAKLKEDGVQELRGIYIFKKNYSEVKEKIKKYAEKVDRK